MVDALASFGRAGPVHATPTLPAGATVDAITLVGAKGAMRAELPQGPGPMSLTARTWYEHVTRPAGHVVLQVPEVPSVSTGALAHATLLSSQFPTQRRPS